MRNLIGALLVAAALAAPAAAATGQRPPAATPSIVETAIAVNSSGPYAGQFDTLICLEQSDRAHPALAEGPVHGVRANRRCVRADRRYRLELCGACSAGDIHSGLPRRARPSRCSRRHFVESDPHAERAVHEHVCLRRVVLHQRRPDHRHGRLRIERRGPRDRPRPDSYLGKRRVGRPGLPKRPRAPALEIAEPDMRSLSKDDISTNLSIYPLPVAVTL